MGATETPAEIRARLQAAHPTGKAPASVVFCALGPSRNGLMIPEHIPPTFLTAADELWGINSGANMLCGRIAYDLLWVMDYLDGEARREPQYVDLVMKWLDRHPNSHIMTSVAGSFARERIHEYPLNDIARLFGKNHRYFTTSVPYIIVYSWAIGVQRLVLFGADYMPADGHAVWETQHRACTEYWVGLVRGLGMAVSLPDTTELCGSNCQPIFYGYPRIE